MTELREQLLTARDEYRSARYPGDLATELLPPASAPPAPRPWGMATFLVRLTGVAFAAAAAVALVVVRPPDRMTDPRVDGNLSRVAPAPAVAKAGHRDGPHGWWFAPDLTFASVAAERVKTVAMRVQMRITLPYRDLRMPAMLEWPTLTWPDWARGGDRDAEAQPDTRHDPDASPQSGPSTRQAV